MFKLVKFTSGNVVNNEKKITKDIVEKYGNINNSEIAENNIEISKRMDNVQFLCSSIVGWLNANPGKNLLDLEKRFRFLNNGIYLIPRESDSKDSKIFSLPKFEKQEKYYISVILSDDIDIKNYYDENNVDREKILRRLPRTGILFPNDVDVNKLLGYKKSKLDDLELKHKLMYNFTRLERKLEDPSVELENNINDAIKIHKKNPDQSLIAKFNETDGDVIVGYSMSEEKDGEIKDTLISYIGHYIKLFNVNGEVQKKYQLVDIRDKSTWKWISDKQAENKQVEK